MKRIICFLLVAIMSFSLVACGEKEEQTEEQPEQKEIQLTLDNIEEYLDVKVEFINYLDYCYRDELFGFLIYAEKEDVSLMVSPKHPGEFFLADIQIEVPLYDCWYEDLDHQNDKADADIEYSFRIPKSGEYTADIVEIDRDTDYANYSGMRNYRRDANEPLYIIKSISGYFVKD